MANLGVQFRDRILVRAAKLVQLFSLRFEGMRPILHRDLTPLTQLIDVNANSRLDPIPAGYGERVGLKGRVPALYFDDGQLQRLQFTRNGVYYLLFAARGRFHGWIGRTVRGYRPLTSRHNLMSIANSFAPRTQWGLLTARKK